MGGEDLAEDFGRYFEVSVVVEVLEERLGVQSVFPDYFLKLAHDV